MTDRAPTAPQFRIDMHRWWPMVPLIIGLGAVIVPTLLSLKDQIWSTEAGAHGPIVLMTGAWLLWRQAVTFRESGVSGNLFITLVVLVVSLALHIFGRSFDYISLEAAGAYGAAISVLYSFFGARPLLRNWFPLLYLAFLLPAPGWLLDELTAPLKQFVSFCATQSLSAVGVPVARQGVTIYVAQYQLLVEDACSGLNSLVGLTAISLFYIYLLRASSLTYSAILATLVLPIAVAGNIIRIMILILLTYFFGDSVAQGFLHFAAGLFLFAIDLLLVFAADRQLSIWLPKLGVKV